MSVLDSFTFLLTADERRVVDALRRTGREFDDLVDRGEDATDDLADNFDDAGNRIKRETSDIQGSLKGLLGDITGLGGVSLAGLAGAAAGAGAAFLSLGAIIEHTGDILERVKAAEAVGVDISQYDALSKAFQANGVDADGFRDSVIDLNEAMGEALSDGDSGKAKSFKDLGVSLKGANGQAKEVDKVLLELSGKLAGMSKQQATFQIKALGITDNAVIAAMLKGNDALQKQIDLQKESGVLTLKDAENAKALAAAQNELHSIMGSIADKITTAVTPVLIIWFEAMAKIVKWMENHKGFLVGFFGIMAAAAVPALAAIAAAAWAAILPFTPFIAAAVALGLAVDDLWNYFSGGESVIGDLAARFPALKELLDETGEEVKWLVDQFKLFATDPEKYIKTLDDTLNAFWRGIVYTAQTGIDNFIAKCVEGWNNLGTDTKKIFQELWDWIINLFSNLGNIIGDSINDAASSAWNSAKSWVGLGTDDNPQSELGATAGAANGALAGAAAMPIITSSAGKVSNVNQTSQVTIEKVEVQTQATDANGISVGIANGLSDHLQGTAQQFDDGVSH